MGKTKSAAAKAAEIEKPVAEEAAAAMAETAPEATAEEPTDAAPAEEAAEAARTEEPADKAPAVKAKKAAVKKPAYPDFLKSYVKAYPGEKVFHVTADRQVFLDRDYSYAKLHQRGLGKGEITTYNL